MTRLALFLTCLLGLSACKSEPGYHDDVTWTLTELGGVAFAGEATLSFPEAGRLAGDAPCNGYFASQTAEYPGFAPGPIGATRRACPALPLELAYLAMLERMTSAEIIEDRLTLTGPAGLTMVFRKTDG